MKQIQDVPSRRLSQFECQHSRGLLERFEGILVDFEAEMDAATPRFAQLYAYHKVSIDMVQVYLDVMPIVPDKTTYEINDALIKSGHATEIDYEKLRLDMNEIICERKKV